MAGNLQTYSLVFVTIQNALLTEEGSVSWTETTGSQAVGTVAKGYAGESPGMGMMNGTIESAMPLAGIEYDPSVVMNGLIPIEIGFAAAGKVKKAKGYIIEAEYKHALNSESKQTLRFRLQPASFE